MTSLSLQIGSKPAWLEFTNNASTVILILSVLVSVLLHLVPWIQSNRAGPIKLVSNQFETTTTRKGAFHALLLSQIDGDMKSDGEATDLEGFWKQLSKKRSILNPR